MSSNVSLLAMNSFVWLKIPLFDIHLQRVSLLDRSSRWSLVFFHPFKDVLPLSFYFHILFGELAIHLVFLTLKAMPFTSWCFLHVLFVFCLQQLETTMRFLSLFFFVHIWLRVCQPSWICGLLTLLSIYTSFFFLDNEYKYIWPFCCVSFVSFLFPLFWFPFFSMLQSDYFILTCSLFY